MRRRKLTMYDIIGVGFMSALVFVASQISFPIPSILGLTRIHLGNAFCLLSGFLLGGLKGGLAAGIGSMFFDLVNPAYVSEAPITFINKFMMGFVCGSISLTKKTTNFNILRNIVAGILGALTYVLLYLSKTFIGDVYFLRAEVATALLDVLIKARVSLINAAIAVIISVPASAVILLALSNTLLFRKIRSL
ncbi:MAG: ECF transporter S component [Eubacteriales bacterium]|jgi:uncharacterized membrane protein